MLPFGRGGETAVMIFGSVVPVVASVDLEDFKP